MTHTTRWGNKYSDSEWQEMQADFQEEHSNITKAEEALEKMANYLRRELDEMGLPSNAIANIVYTFKNFTFPEKVASGEFQFSSQEKADKLNDLWQRWEAKAGELIRW